MLRTSTTPVVETATSSLRSDHTAEPPTLPTTTTTNATSPWRRRHARTAEEGIRRERTSERLSTLETEGKHYAARTLSGLITALAEEVSDLDVQVEAQRQSPLWGKQVDAVRIQFSRLGFKPLKMGGGVWHTAVDNADEAFDQMDVDKSGFLDREEIAQALSLVTKMQASQLRELAGDLLKLYDFNGDGVVDRNEYKSMVEDMAALRREQEDVSHGEVRDNEGWFAPVREFATSLWTMVGFRNSTTAVNETIQEIRSIELPRIEAPSVTALAERMQANGKTLPSYPEANGKTESDAVFGSRTVGSSEIVNLSDDSSFSDDAIAKTLGSITLSDRKLDLRRLLCGAVPILKHITPGGPLVLEPFTVTINGSFNREDIMSSFLLDAGLRRLVARVLRLRVRGFRDFVDGAVFFGRSWKDSSATAPVVDVPELTNVEFDKQNRLIITGRAKVRTSPDAPQLDQAFKVRTKIGTRQDGRLIRLEEPELAFVLECPKSWERNIRAIYDAANMKMPPRPKPLYSFFPIYSPFKVNDNDGFDLGEDNAIKSIYVQDGALRFEMSAILRPGRFLGNHYLAFSVPNRTFIITLERVKEGIRAARKMKQAAKALEQSSRRKERKLARQKGPPVLSVLKSTAFPTTKVQPTSFFSRFVDGYLQAEDDTESVGMANAIRDFFGRQRTRK